MIPLITTAMMLVAGIVAGQSLGGAWDRISKRYVADLRPILDSLSMDQRNTQTLLRWWGLSMVASFIVLTFVLEMFPIAVAVVLLLLLAPRWILKFIIDRRRTLLRDQLVGGTISLANACRAGLSLAQGLETVGGETSQPLARELQQIVNEYEHGRSLTEAIASTKERLGLDSFTLLPPQFV